MKKVTIVTLLIVGIMLILFGFVHAGLMNFILFDREINMAIIALGLGLILGLLRIKKFS